MVAERSDLERLEASHQIRGPGYVECCRPVESSGTLLPEQLGHGAQESQVTHCKSIAILGQN